VKLAAAGVLAALPALVSAQPRPPLELKYQARALRPGEVVRLVARAAPSAAVVRGRAFDRDVHFMPAADGAWEALVGIDVETPPGPYDVTVEAVDAEGALLASVRRVLRLGPRRAETRRLVLPEAFVRPPVAVRARIDEEARQLEVVLAAVTPERVWRGAFAPPVSGSPTSGFGRRSVVNGEVRGLHAGVDFRAPVGTPVRAPARGRIALATEHYMAGRLVVIDHGLGLFSILAHLDRLDVSEHQVVERGEVIGRSGASGRVTGPHLHWGVRLLGARVDPLSLVAVTAKPFL
jgi:murein DD-endopeptidase MepM/ murein hydrolase activator NlpD